MRDEHNPQGWTFATLYTHIMALSLASKEAISAAMEAARVAGDKADKATEKRFDGVNEFRAAMKDQQLTFADKESVERRLSNLETFQATQTGKEKGVGLSAGILVHIITSLAAASSVIGVILATRH